jgi:hypothetical protein
MHNRRRFMALSAAAVVMELPCSSQARTLDRPARLMVGFPAARRRTSLRDCWPSISGTTHRPSWSITDPEPAAACRLKP